MTDSDTNKSRTTRDRKGQEIGVGDLVETMNGARLRVESIDESGLVHFEGGTYEDGNRLALHAKGLASLLGEAFPEDGGIGSRSEADNGPDLLGSLLGGVLGGSGISTLLAELRDSRWTPERVALHGATGLPCYGVIDRADGERWGDAVHQVCDLLSKGGAPYPRAGEQVTMERDPSMEPIVWTAVGPDPDEEHHWIVKTANGAYSMVDVRTLIPVLKPSDSE